MSGAAAAAALTVADKVGGVGDRAAAVLTDTKAKRWVLVGVAGTGVITLVAVTKREGDLPGPRLLAGVAVAGGLLALLAEFVPKVAAGLATLMLLTAAFGLGPDTWTGITRITPPADNTLAPAPKN